VILDLAVYAQHRVFHFMPFFWRFHQVHHADLTLDVSSAVRFHAVEILFSQAWKIVVVVAAGVPPEAAFAFEVVLNVGSMFSHANFALPSAVERIARLFVVTPDMHRIHHSVLRDEMNSNFGFNFSVWDRLFGSYVARPQRSAAVMEMGLPDHRGRSTSSIPWLMAMPFREGSSS
jgi:sterol desaturase/sphingolipid hydroxylase (fatty acid hydroxylase superfamily)